MKLTTHFTMEELTRSQTAVRRGIDNEVPTHLFNNIMTLATFLEELRGRLSTYYEREMFINVSSGYRCPMLNRAIRGSSTSAHMDALAADITASTITSYELANFIARTMSNYGYDQVIHEFGRWVHIGLRENPNDQRLQLLTAKKINDQTIYVNNLERVA